MIIRANNTDYELTFKARQMIKIGEQIGGQYELELGAYKSDIKTLATLVSILCDALNYEQALDVIDELVDNGKSIRDLYTDIFNDMNNKAFFMSKLVAQDTPPIDIQAYMSQMMSEVGAEMSNKAKTEALKSMSTTSKR